MSTPMEENGGGDATGGDAALPISSRTRKRGQVSEDVKEETGMVSKGVQAKRPVCNVRWHYEGLIKYYHHRRMMEKATNYVKKRNRIKSGTKRRFLDKRYNEEINKEIVQANKKVDALRKNSTKGEKKDKKQKVSQKSEGNGKKEKKVAKKNLEKKKSK